MDLYKKEILDHYKNPRNFGKIKTEAKSTHGENPSCGDSINMDIVFKQGRIENIKFSGDGCAIAIAAASMLTEKVKGMKIVDVADIGFQDIQKLLGVEVSHSRKNCAILALNVLRKMVLQELKQQK
ncbi:iron-sulfur cluster assembly scaffold protein [Candidatus Dojkabacteria bacterium]|nr:iron-sulfur cluster assembly scaffold protein [Candidatus Dojkabacteria bacterium]